MAMSAVEYFLQILRFMTAFDDFRTVIVFSYKILKMAESWRSVGFCEENVVCTEDMFDGFPHESAWEDVMIVERRGGIDENNIDVCFESEVLKSVIEDQNVGSEFVDGVESGFHAVLVDEHSDIFKIGCQHIRFVASCD